MLLCFSKILERIMYNGLYGFVIKIEIIYESQFGFQAAHSPQHVILELVNGISKSSQNVKFTLSIFIDFSKAFDTIDHTILSDKRNQYGMKNKYFDWFKCYLNNRKQFVSYGEEHISLKLLDALSHKGQY